MLLTDTNSIHSPIATDQPEISLHAVVGQLHLHTFRMDGSINNHRVQVLINGGSTHNFIKHRLVNFVKLSMISTPPFNILVGKGDQLTYSTKCSTLTLSLQNKIFTIDYFVLLIQGVDIVLGIQWLQQFGNIITNFTSLTMSFQLHDNHIQLHGNKPIPISLIQYHQLSKLSSQGSIASCFHLFSNPSHSPTFIPPPPPSTLQPLIDTYVDLFAPPTNLPPSSHIDHQIPLQPKTPPINTRPYVIYIIKNLPLNKWSTKC